jgi:branched-chain amino acid transport system ATP-binding protein
MGCWLISEKIDRSKKSISGVFLLRVNDLNVKFGKSHVVRGVSFSVAASQIAVILGRNGVGKTTTLKAIIGIVPRSGSMQLGDTSISTLRADRIARAGLGYVPQGRQLFAHLTVLENLQLAWHGRTFNNEALDRGISHFPPLRELLGRYAGTLSGGEQQMVAIGRALMNQPAAILLDEPTEGLSPLFVERVQEVVASLRTAGMAIVLVEQNLNSALHLGDEIHFMEKGVLAHTCSPHEARSSQAIERYLGVSAAH